MTDYVIRAMAGNGMVRAFFATMRNTVNSAQIFHKTSPVASAALGRTLIATSMMGLMLKDEKDIISVSIKGDGPIGGILATSDSKGWVRGYAFNPQIDLPLKSNGKLDVSGSIGAGVLSVMKDLGLKKPYAGNVALVSSEVAEDITYYFAKSEQTPSAVALGVLVDVDYSIKQAGGFIIQMMPGAQDELIDAIEAKLDKISSVTTMLDAGMTPEAIMNEVLGDFNVEILVKHEVQYHCNCSKDVVEKALISLGKQELTQIINEDKKAELCCHFCDKKYSFDSKELESILTKI